MNENDIEITRLKLIIMMEKEIGKPRAGLGDEDYVARESFQTRLKVAAKAAIDNDWQTAKAHVGSCWADVPELHHCL
jgi:hypothetical protein